MTHTYRTRLGGAQQLHQLPRASGPCVLPGPAVRACATRRGEHPHRPAVPPVQLHYLETPVTTRSRPEGAAEHADQQAVLDLIRAELAEQPSEETVRAVGRRWCQQVTAMADAIADACPTRTSDGG